MAYSVTAGSCGAIKAEILLCCWGSSPPISICYFLVIEGGSLKDYPEVSFKYRIFSWMLPDYMEKTRDIHYETDISFRHIL